MWFKKKVIPPEIKELQQIADSCNDTYMEHNLQFINNRIKAGVNVGRHDTYIPISHLTNFYLMEKNIVKELKSKGYKCKVINWCCGTNHCDADLYVKWN